MEARLALYTYGVSTSALRSCRLGISFSFKSNLICSIRSERCAEDIGNIEAREREFSRLFVLIEQPRDIYKKFVVLSVKYRVDKSFAVKDDT